MKERICIVVGGGYAGIHAIKAIRKTFEGKANKHALRIIVMDQNPFHTRKVLLFKPAVTNEDIRIPLTKLFPEDVEFIQGTAKNIESVDKKLNYQDGAGKLKSMHYDMIVVAIGSIVRQPDIAQGGIALASLDASHTIKETWHANLKKAFIETDATERQRLMTIAIGGAGISGMETAAELAHYVSKEAESIGLDPSRVRIHLFNSNKSLFPAGPSKVGLILERSLRTSGVTVTHDVKIVQENEGVLTLSSGKKIPVGLCIWTLGLLPNPMLRNFGLPITLDGHLIVDTNYRVEGACGVYSIGDCARIVDSASGQTDGKTCKEAIAQATRLAKIVLADLEGRPAPEHKRYMDFFCFGLGPNQGMAWTQICGFHFIFTGKLGRGLRKFTWNSASLLK
ncbi:NADH dehydrogenase [Paenibacillus shirakamiensis]|uniref:NADH:ubiquinone reductase (non-electrogenic) n=1 Tax=Paenibacillus shirakamiensis TaxID=1265935 RepID=A0ABS4JIE9_9BACL|nr:FAD-dependent oxidoreductase [Paenibacillus shirakamiensis]MBP2000860.1 NADH dehydrogenase [Paenibacillus shirakamiensis]